MRTLPVGNVQVCRCRETYLGAAPTAFSTMSTWAGALRVSTGCRVS